MKRNTLLILTFILLLFFCPILVFAVNADSVNINLQITGTCNNNNFCEPDLGEDETSCLSDCGCDNNGGCDSSRGETEQNCPSDCIIVLPTYGKGGMVPNIFKIKNIFVYDVGYNSANISWQTTKFSTCQISLGETSNYEREIISETENSTVHFLKISDLDHSTKYYFKIFCAVSSQENDQVNDQQFQTLNMINNVTGFTAKAEDGKIKLSWDNPPDKNFVAVKILRNEDFYPLNPSDGKIIYEGSSNYFEDNNISVGKVYYYTVFSEDNNRYSSGASAVVNIKTDDKTDEDPSKEEIILPPENKPGNQLNPISIEDLKFISEGKDIFINNNYIETRAGKTINISIDCNKILKAKAVLVNLYDNEKIYQFILRSDSDKKSCDASIILFKEPGEYPLKLLILGENGEILKQINLGLRVLEDNLKINLLNILIYSALIFLSVLLLIIIVIKIKLR